jgi:cell wall-associated NlpC family hydrolase
MMNTKLAIACVILTLAGCTASTATASKALLPVVNKPAEVVKEVNVKAGLLKSTRINKNTAQMEKVIKYLKTRVGKTSYVFSGSSPRGWDCSGLVRWTYKRFGIELPHSANKQGHVGKRVSTPKPGDIVVFAYNGSTNFYHSGLYIGDRKIINAHYGAGSTIIQPLTDYSSNQIRFVRIIETK